MNFTFGIITEIKNKKRMKKQLFIHHHLGLGDHIICNALVRNVVKNYGYEKYFLFCKEQNCETVAFMFRDLSDLQIISIRTDNDVDILAQMGLPLLKIGFENVQSADFDRDFYKQLNIPFEKRWSDFYVERDLEREKKFFSTFNVKEGEYIFIHDDGSRHFNIEENYIINKEMPIVRPIKGLTNNSFDYCYLMEKSKEAHFIDSSFRLIFDSLQLKNDDIFYHLHLKGDIMKDYDFISNSKLNFKLI